MQGHVLDEAHKRASDHVYPQPHPLGVDAPPYLRLANAMLGDTTPPTVHPAVSADPVVQANAGRHDRAPALDSRWVVRLGIMVAAYMYGPGDLATRAALGYGGAALIDGMSPLVHGAVAYGYVALIGRPAGYPLVQFAVPSVLLSAVGM